MSTKINARSPFYIKATAPTPILGAFTCTTANLTNFSVAPDGTITEPNILKGTIIDRDATSFPALNIGDSSVLRTVNYTILIPDGYSNSADKTKICPQSFTQVAPAASCDSSTNTNMATFSGTIGDITNLDETAQTVSLGSFFTQQGGATFKKYVVNRVGSPAIEFSPTTLTSVSETLSFTTASTGVSATFTVTAHNNDDSCTTSSNAFTVSAAATGSLVCGDLNITGGSITQAGVITRPSYEAIASIYKVYVGATDYTTTDYPANTNTTARTVTLKLYFRVPSGYDNATPASSTDLNDYLLCTKDVQQAGTQLSALACGDDIIAYSGFRISQQGTIVLDDAQVTVNGVVATGVSATTDTGAAKFNEVANATARTIDVTFDIPSGYSNSGTLTCEDAVSLTQPASDNPCIVLGNEYYISNQAFSSRFGFCDNNGVYSITHAVNGTVAVGEAVCDNGVPFNGGNNYYAQNENPSSSGAGNIGTTFKVIRIDNEGLISEIHTVQCESDAPFDNAL